MGGGARAGCVSCWPGDVWTAEHQTADSRGWDSAMVAGGAAANTYEGT
jgi:hypothetical protein